jgi:ABC-type nitrate/sulfonate/bicarbonate transport system permease component
MRTFKPVRNYVEPAIQFLRFVPAIAWITSFIIFNSRLYLVTDLVFVGIVTLGTLGLLCDLIFQAVTTRIFGRHGYG